METCRVKAWDVSTEAARHPQQFAQAQRQTKPVFLRHDRLEGWSADLAIYAVWCDDCQRHTVSHLAGYGRINCRNCRVAFRVMTWARFRDKILRPLLYGRGLTLTVGMTTALLLAIREFGLRF